MRRVLLFLLCSLPSLAHDGQADHLPKHGGIVFTSGFLDLEFVPLKPKGRYAVYFNGASGEELPASTVSDVTISIRRSAGAAENLSLRMACTGESWLASGTSSECPIAGAGVSYRFRGKTEQVDVPSATVFHAEFRTAPEAVKAGVRVQLSFTVRDFFGKSVRALQIVHEKPMHLMIVSRDLAEFYHIHPEPSQGGVFRVSHIFPHGGDYRLFADFTPLGASARIAPFDLKVQGAPRAAIPLDPVAGWNSAVGGVRMTLSADKPLRAGQDIGLSMAIFDTKTGAPIHNLQRYLGAWAHIAIVSQDLQDFIHVHPMEDTSAGPVTTIRTSAGFRRPRLYKMMVQGQRQDQGVAGPSLPLVGDGAGSGPPLSPAPSRATPI